MKRTKLFIAAALIQPGGCFADVACSVDRPRAESDAA
jgi:hypothetical protein